MSYRSDIFSAMVENISQGIYVIQDDRAIYLNRPFAEMFGFESAEALIGRDMFRSIYPDPHSVDLFEQVHREMLDHGAEVNSWAQLSARRDGTPFWLEVEARRICVDGRPAIFGRFHDQTDCQIIARTMHASQETLRLVLDGMEDLVYVVTDDHRIVYANDKMRRSLDADIDSAPCHRLCHGQVDPCEDCAVGLFRGQSGPVSKELFNQRTGRWYSVIEMAIRTPGVDRPTKLAVARDISARKRSEDQVRALSHRLLSAQEEERLRLARELHDDVGQQLNTLKMGLESLSQDLAGDESECGARLDHLTEVLQSSTEAVRNLSAGLRPAALERFGLVEAIRAHCRSIAQGDPLPIDFRAAGLDQVTIPSELAINLFRVVQEGLNNIIKHAGASRVTIRLTASYPHLRLRIEDDGRGFEVDEQKGDRMQFGLLGITERARQLNGSFTLRSRPGRGTCIIFEVPIAASPAMSRESAGDRYGKAC